MLALSDGNRFDVYKLVNLDFMIWAKINRPTSPVLAPVFQRG